MTGLCEEDGGEGEETGDGQRAADGAGGAREFGDGGTGGGWWDDTVECVR